MGNWRMIGKLLTSRYWLVAWALLLPGILGPARVEASEPDSAPAQRGPNIVLINADDLGWKDVGYQGTDFYETPRIDQLAREGMAFSNAYANAGNCAPSRACLMTGFYTPRHAVYAVGDTNRGPAERMILRPVPNELPLKPRFVTMAEALRQAGYATGQFGKWHLGDANSGTSPLDQGFDVSRDWPQRGSGVAEDPKSVDSITDAAIEFIQDHREGPFFCYVAHHAIHTGLQGRAETLERFRAKERGEQHKAPLYAACLFDLDAAVGRLVDEIDRLGLGERTIIVFVSDNGATPQSSQEPLRGAKGAYYEGGIRIPFIVRWPGRVEAGTQCDEPVIQTDLLPTFLGLAQVDARDVGFIDTPLDGTDLQPLLQGETLPEPRSIYWHFPGYLDRPVPRGRDSVLRTAPVSVVRRGPWKLFLYHEEWLLEGGRDGVPTNDAVELYHLGNDPGERENLAATEVETREALLEDLLGWFEQTDAQLPGLKDAGTGESR